MAYDSNTKKVTAPIRVGDVADALGESSLSIGDLCSSSAINMWAKYKPVQYANWGILTEAERKSANFGIVVSGYDPSASLDSNMSKMHQVSFSYAKPYGGASSPYRLLDFDGYKHNAVPNPYASLGGTDIIAFYNDSAFAEGGLTGLSVRYSDTNTEGVDLTDMITSPGVALSDTLARAYPCILVTDASGNSYFTALTTKLTDGSYGPRPMLYNGVYAGAETWFVKMSKPRRSATDLSGGTAPPWSSAQTGMKATLFLLKSASLSQPLLSAAGDNFHTYWIKADGFVATDKPSVLPGAVGANLTLRQYSSGVIFQPTNVAISIVNNRPSFGVSLQETTGRTSNNSITVRVVLTLDDGYTISSNRVINGWSSSSLAPAILLNASDYLHAPGTQYKGKVTVTTQDGSSSNVRTMEFNETV